MRILSILSLMLLAAVAQAVVFGSPGPHGTSTILINDDVTDSNTYWLAPAASGAPWFVSYTGSPVGATTTTVGTGLSLSGGVLSCTVTGASAPSQSSASSRSIGTSGWQVSTLRPALVSYSASISTSLSLTGGSAGYISLEIASNSGFTANLQELARLTNGQTGTLTVGLALNQTTGGALTGFVPTGYYTRLKSTNTTGTPTYAYVCGQEVLQ